jgi:hypothetical protein
MTVVFKNRNQYGTLDPETYEIIPPETDEELMNKCIEKAKQKAEDHYNGHNVGVKRNWLEATPEHSYGNEDYKATMFVLEGSAPKGYVIANYSYGVVKALDMAFKTLATYEIYDYDIRV